MDPVSWLSILYLGLVGTVVGFVWFYQGIEAIGPVRAGQFINFVPVSGVLLAWLLLDEPLSLSLIFGTLAVISGVVMTSRARR